MLCCQVCQEYSCKIVLLDGRELKYNFKGSLKANQVLNEVARFLNLSESDYFGLRYYIGDDGDEIQQVQWLDLNKSIQSQFKKLTDIVLFFNVKYYVSEPCKLKYENTRYLYFLQLRQDILQGRLPVDYETSIDLFGYVLQDELGDFNPKRDSAGYASEFPFIRNQTEELENDAHLKHVKLKGLSPQLCEMNFLNKVKWLDMYGVDLQPVIDKNNIEIFIGLTPTGISFYRNKEKLSNYLWTRIVKIDYKSTQFFLKTDEKVHTFTLKTKLACKHLWKCCMDQYEFFYRLKTMHTSPVLSPKASNGLASTKNRQSIRSLNHFSLIHQNDPVRREPSKRVPRRIPNILGDEAIVFDENLNSSIPLQRKYEGSIYDSQRSLAKVDWRELENQGGLLTNGRISPTGSNKSSNSYRVPNPRRESASESEHGHRRRRARSSSRRKNVGSDSDENENNASVRSKSRTRRHRSGSRSSQQKMVSSESQWNNVLQQQQQRNQARIMKSKSLIGPGMETAKGAGSETCHETTLDEIDYNELEKKRQVRRRKRSKSPSASKPPSELRQHIHYEMVESNGMSMEQLREIPFVKIETSAPLYRISPHQKQRKYSPHRRKSKDFHESKSSIGFLRDGTAQVVKTNNPNSDQLVQPTVTMYKSNDAATNKVMQRIEMSNEQDSGCDEMQTYLTKQT